MGSFDFGGGYFGEYDEGGTSGPASQTLAGSSGIASGGAFGSAGVIIGGTATITGSAGIVSGGAFGTNGKLAFLQFIAGSSGVISGQGFGTNGVIQLTSQVVVGSLGIPSGGAFGANGNMVYPQFPTGSAGIPSGEAFGVGSLQLALPVPVEDCDLVLAPVQEETITVTATPSLGTYLGTGTSGDGEATLVLTVTDNQTANDSVHLFWLTDHFGDPILESQLFLAADSRGGTWIIQSNDTTESYGLVGQTQETDASTDDYLIGSFIRSAGDLLQTGDTITLTFSNTVQHPAPTLGIAIAQGFVGVTIHAADQQLADYGGASPFTAGVIYNNGDSTTDQPDPNILLWRVDYDGLTLNPFPVANSAYIGLFASRQGSGFVPEQLGSVVRSATNGSFYLAVVWDPLVSAGTVGLEPGGTFVNSTSNVGNYQFIEIGTVTEGVDLCDLDLEPEVEDCDLVLVPFAPRVIGSTGTGRLLVGEAGIPSAEAFGAGALQTILGGTGQDGLGIAGIRSGETFGAGGIISAGAARLIGPHGISSGGGFGTGGSVNAGNVLILSGGGIVSAETFGLTGKVAMYLKGSTGIPSGGSFGSTGILNFTTGIKGTSGIASAGAFGTNGKMIVTIKGSSGIPSPQSGTRFMSLTAGTTQVGGTATAEIDSDGFGTNGSIS